MSLRTLSSFLRASSVISRFPSLCCNNRFVHDYVNKAMPELEEVGTYPQKKSHWLSYNEKIFPPQHKDEPRRPAYVCHMRENIKYSPKKLWYIACFVRGMSVDEAIKQLSFIYRKGAEPVKQTIMEARDMAVKDHNVEFASNLWVAESFVGTGQVVKGLRRHARRRIGHVEYKHTHYFVRLEEGEPPLDYYNRPPTDKQSLLNKYMKEMRSRNIKSSL